MIAPSQRDAARILRYRLTGIIVSRPVVCAYAHESVQVWCVNVYPQGGIAMSDKLQKQADSERHQTSGWGADTYTLYLNGAPIEIWAQDDDDARRIAGNLIARAEQIDTWELRRDRDDACIGRGKAERYVAEGWKASADSPLRGPF